MHYGNNLVKKEKCQISSARGAPKIDVRKKRHMSQQVQNQKKKNYMDAIVKLQYYLCPCVALFENTIQEKKRIFNNKKIKKSGIEIHPLYLGARETLFIKMYQNNLMSAYRFLKEDLGVCECETIN